MKGNTNSIRWLLNIKYYVQCISNFYFLYKSSKFVIKLFFATSFGYIIIKSVTEQINILT